MELTCLSRGESDHTPLLLSQTQFVNRVPKPYRPFDAWFDHLSFKDFAIQ